jgi:hypothetical protein
MTSRAKLDQKENAMNIANRPSCAVLLSMRRSAGEACLCGNGADHQLRKVTLGQRE